jgi:TM2 domain-containing membrane protein YozV
MTTSGAGANLDLANAVGQGQPRTKITAAILALLLGAFGLHKFYLGQTIWGVAYILLVWTFIPAIIGFIEGLNFLFMSEQVFNEKYAGPAWKA